MSATSLRSALAAPAIVAVFIVACGGDDGDVQPMTCNPQVGVDVSCPDGQRCRIVAGGATECLAVVPADGGNCTPRSCPAGASCLSVGEHLACRIVCRNDDDCGGAGRCTLEVAAPVDTSVWKVCAEPCTLGEGAGACSASAACAPTAGLPYPTCVAAGPARNGETCGEFRRCGRGLACLAVEGPARCRTLCQLEGVPCPAEERCAGRISGLDTTDIRWCIGR